MPGGAARLSDVRVLCPMCCVVGHFRVERHAISVAADRLGTRVVSEMCRTCQGAGWLGAGVATLS